MKLIDLFERMTAGVHENEVKSLFVISGLIEKRFGVRNPSGGGVCLVAQVVMSIAATTGLKPKQIIDQFYAKAGKRLYHEGITLEKILDTLQKVHIKDDEDQEYKLKLSMTGYENTDSMLAAVKSGQPVIIVASNYGAFRNLLDYIEIFKHHDDSTGVGTLKMFRDKMNAAAEPKGSGMYHHALLVLGYDVAEKTVIIRDIRDSYGYKGYYKLERAIFDKHWKLIRIAFSVDVDDMSKVKEVKKDGNTP